MPASGSPQVRGRVQGVQCPELAVAETAGQSDAAIGCAAAVESAAAPLMNVELDPRCVQCHAKRSHRAQGAKCSTLAGLFAIQDRRGPATAPGLRKRRRFPAALDYPFLEVRRRPEVARASRRIPRPRAAGMPIVAEFVEKGTIVQTPYEPWNGDVMLGLPEHLPARKAAHEERKKLVACLAAKYGHRAGWNEDGTGWLASPCQNCAQICGSVWDLLSYLSAIEPGAGKRPRSLN